MRAAHRRDARIVTSGAEHPAVLETARIWPKTSRDH
ncbi:hypothetical protein NKH77_25100 [Streptomyces sp. M19]